MQVIPYSEQLKSEWNEFVSNAVNSTFLINRNFMDYHQDRFEDCSLLFYNKKGLRGIIPANKDGRAVFSHTGLTYGGLIWGANCYSSEISEMLSDTLRYYKDSLGVEKFYYKPIPHIYHKIQAESDLYFLHSFGAKLHARGLSTAIDLTQVVPCNQMHKRHSNKALREGIQWKWAETQEEWGSYWNLLEQVLLERHQTTPVHNLYEILLLKSRFEQQIRLVIALQNNQIIAGTVLFFTQTVVHAQYIAANDQGRNCGALDFLFEQLIKSNSLQGRKYLDFGISTEEGGKILNEGLLFQKEAMGGRGVCYDEYVLTL